jgi:hypothetical protein
MIVQQRLFYVIIYLTGMYGTDTHSSYVTSLSSIADQDTYIT